MDKNVRMRDTLYIGRAGTGVHLLENATPTAYIRTMKRWGRLIFIFIAYSFALLHTAVPHHHAALRNGETTISHVRCSGGQSGGLLQRALSTDLGYGHLENFKKSSNTEVDFSVDPSPLLHLVPKAIVSLSAVSFTPAFDGYIAKLKCRLLLFASAQFRAPPQLS